MSVLEKVLSKEKMTATIDGLYGKGSSGKKQFATTMNSRVSGQ